MTEQNAVPTAPTPGEPSGDQSGTSPKDLLAETTRLREKLAESRDLNRQAEPLVQLAQALYNTPGGKEIIQKLKEGKPLTATQQNAAAAANATSQAIADGVTPGGQSTVGIHPDEVRKMMREEFRAFEEHQWNSRKAEREMEALEAKAEEELDGYGKLRNTKRWKQSLNTTLALMEQRTLDVPDEEDDALYWAVKHTYQTLTGMAPGEKKVTPAKKTESQRRAAIAGQQGKSGGAPEEPEEHANNPDLAWARSRGTGTLGKSFSSPSRNR